MSAEVYVHAHLQNLSLKLCNAMAFEQQLLPQVLCDLVVLTLCELQLLQESLIFFCHPAILVFGVSKGLLLALVPELQTTGSCI